MNAEFHQQQHLEGRIDQLANEIASRVLNVGETMIWIGSGLSIGSGYPEWRTAVIELCRECLPDKTDIQLPMVGSDLLDLAQKCKDANPTQYTRTLAQLFGQPPRSIRPAYSSICACPFRYLVTTNFDPCLETASGMHHGVLAYPDILLLPNRFSNTILYLHGKARWRHEIKANNLLFTAKELDEAYENSFIPSSVNSLLAGFPSIFVGCGLQEVVLKNLFKKLREIHARTNVPEKQKTILLPDEYDADKRALQTRDLEDLGIEVLRFPLDESSAGEYRYRYLDEVWARVRYEVTQDMQPII